MCISAGVSGCFSQNMQPAKTKTHQLQTHTQQHGDTKTMNHEICIMPPFICATLVSLSSDKETGLTKQQVTGEKNQHQRING